MTTPSLRSVAALFASIVVAHSWVTDPVWAAPGNTQVESLAQQWAQQAATLAENGARQAFAALYGAEVPVKVEVEPGELDPRLKLAACADVRITPSNQPQQPPWGRTRVKIQCLTGPSKWAVYLPLTVRLMAPAVVAQQNLPAGTTLRAEHLQLQAADWAESTSPVMVQTEVLVGRTLATALQTGQALRQTHLRPRVWFAAGESVNVVVQGSGFAVSTSATALGQGLEDQLVRVRLDNGRVLMATPIGPQRVSIRP
jgi:flagellar basal body P-ring formation protein FlgA